MQSSFYRRKASYQIVFHAVFRNQVLLALRILKSPSFASKIRKSPLFQLNGTCESNWKNSSGTLCSADNSPSAESARTYAKSHLATINFAAAADRLRQLINQFARDNTSTGIYIGARMEVRNVRTGA